MIIIRETDIENRRQCNSCNSTNNVLEIIIKKNETSGTVVALCDACRDSLIQLLIVNK